MYYTDCITFLTARWREEPSSEQMPQKPEHNIEMLVRKVDVNVKTQKVKISIANNDR